MFYADKEPQATKGFKNELEEIFDGFFLGQVLGEKESNGTTTTRFVVREIQYKNEGNNDWLYADIVVTDTRDFRTKTRITVYPSFHADKDRKGTYIAWANKSGWVAIEIADLLKNRGYRKGAK